MNEDFVSFELSKKLKEKGFNCEYPFAMYNKYEQFCPLYSSDKDYFGIDDFDKRACIAPTISQVLKWLREEKKLSVEINFGAHPYSCIACWYCTIIKITDYGNRSDLSDFGKDCRVFFSYEESALAGIEYVLDKLI